MKVLKYRLMTEVNHGTEEQPDIQQIFSGVSLGWSEANEEIAKREAYNGEYTIEDVPDDRPLDEIRADKLAELSASCNASITAGMDVETTQGTEHFSLQETDQINLTTALSAVQSGATNYPYHADGQLCRLFTAAEIQAIAGGTVITAAEFAAGLVLNVWLGLGVWDYSGLPCNLLGQICPQFWAPWVLLAGPVIVAFDWLCYWLDGVERPKYHL